MAYPALARRGDPHDDEFQPLMVVEPVDVTAPLTITAAPNPLTNPAYVYLRRLGSDNSRRSMRTSLNIIATIVGTPPVKGTEPTLAGVQPFTGDLTYLGCHWAALRREHTMLIREALIARYGSSASVDARLAALRGTLEEAWRMRQLTTDEYRRAVDVPAAPKEERLARGRVLSEAEIGALLRVCAEDDRPIGLRDGAMILLFYSTALRRAELAALRVEQYVAKDRRIKVLVAKRGKQREVFVEPAADMALRTWLQLRGTTMGPLFCRIDRWNNIYADQGLTDDGIYWALMVRGKQAGIAGFAPHDFRRTAITHLLQNGVDLITVAKLAGHASTNTTRRYDLRPLAAVRAAVDTLGIRDLVLDDLARQRFTSLDDPAELPAAVAANTVVPLDIVTARLRDRGLDEQTIADVMTALDVDDRERT